MFKEQAYRNKNFYEPIQKKSLTFTKHNNIMLKTN